MAKSPAWRLASLSAALLLAQGAQAAVTLTSLKDGHLVVPAYVDGKGPYPFMLDSGADTSGVYQWFADQEKLPPAGATTVSGMTGAVNINQYRVASFKMDGHELGGVTAYALPNRHDGEKIAGVLGNDFMDGTVTEFNFPCGRVMIHPKPADATAIAGKGLAPIQARRQVSDDTLLSFPVSVDGAKGTAVLDTGNRVTKINLRFAKAAGLDPHSSAFHPADAIYGISPTQGIVPMAGPLGTLKIGSQSLEQVQGEIIDIKTFAEDFGDSPVIQIGTDLMGRFRLVYEHDANRFWLAPSSCSH